MCFHSLKTRINIYIKYGSTCTKAAILGRHVSTVAQNEDQLRVSPPNKVTLENQGRHQGDSSQRVLFQ